MGGALYHEPKETMIMLKGISRNYSNGSNTVEALKDINLSIAKGEFIGIMGPSGSGKSTLLNIIGCLDAPNAGDYLMDGKSMNAISKNEKAVIRNRVFGFVFQSFYLMPEQNIAENVALPLKYSKVPRNKWRGQLMDALKAVGLEKLGDRYPDQLSLGQQQKAAIARALVTDPEVILADEPTGNLDTATGQTIMEELMSLNEQIGKTIIVTSHDPRIAGYVRRLIRLEDGILSEDIPLLKADAESKVKKLFAVPDEEE